MVFHHQVLYEKPFFLFARGMHAEKGGKIRGPGRVGKAEICGRAAGAAKSISNRRKET